MSNPEIARYLEKEHLRDAEENDYHLMEGLIKQHRRPVSKRIDIPTNTQNDHVNFNILYDIFKQCLKIICFQLIRLRAHADSDANELLSNINNTESSHNIP